jgi:hypothetical protein
VHNERQQPEPGARCDGRLQCRRRDFYAAKQLYRISCFVYTITNGFGTDSALVSLTVNPAGPTTSSLFSPSGTPGTVTDNDPNAVELGLKFQNSVPANIAAIRFYKGPKNTGTHTALAADDKLLSLGKLDLDPGLQRLALW